MWVGFLGGMYELNILILLGISWFGGRMMEMPMVWRVLELRLGMLMGLKEIE